MEKEISFVLKTVERCNIACTYCYFFFGGDESYKSHPPYIPYEVCIQIADFIVKGCIELNIKKVNIAFHGGEPLMQKKNDFDLMCLTFAEKILPFANLKFSMQTNGMLVDNEWINLFCKYKVRVGVSLDGPREYHDKYRLDKRGKGTYDKVIAGINLLRSCKEMQKYTDVGILTVINPEFSAKKIYRHFVDELSIYNFDFLLPEQWIEAGRRVNTDVYKTFLINIFDEWTKDNNPKIEVRFFKSIINMMLGGNSFVYGFGKTEVDALPLITISSNGELGPVDELRTCPGIIQTHKTINNSSLKDFLEHPIFNEIANSQIDLPKDCVACCWKEICRGGAINHRFSVKNRFKNKSVYCDLLQSIYTEIAAYMINHGYAAEKLANTLNIWRE